MRLISKFKDYYDGCQASDLERSPVWVRAEEVIEIPNLRGSRSQDHGRGLHFNGSTGDALLDEALPRIVAARSWMPDMSGFIRYSSYSSFRNVGAGTARVFVFCCGKLYPYWHATDPLSSSISPPSKACQSVAEVIAFVEGWDETSVDAWSMDIDRKKNILRSLEAQKDAKSGSFYDGSRNYPNNEQGWQKWQQDNSTVLQREYDDLHRHLGTPLFLIVPGTYGRGLCLVKNPVLSKVAFQGIVDAWSMWQSLDFFLGNNMATQMDPDSARTNQGIIDAHGFNEQSFRSVAPGERKARRRENRKRKRDTA